MERRFTDTIPLDVPETPPAADLVAFYTGTAGAI